MFAHVNVVYPLLLFVYCCDCFVIPGEERNYQMIINKYCWLFYTCHSLHVSFSFPSIDSKQSLLSHVNFYVFILASNEKLLMVKFPDYRSHTYQIFKAHKFCERHKLKIFAYLFSRIACLLVFLSNIHSRSPSLTYQNCCKYVTAFYNTVQSLGTLSRKIDIIIIIK